MAIRRKIVITGATDGIGQRAALRLAREGADLVLTARNEEKADRTRALIERAAPDTRVTVYPADFTDLESVAAAGRAIVRDHPAIDVLINNAGLHAFSQRVTGDGFAEMTSVNYLAPWLLTRIMRETLLRPSLSLSPSRARPGPRIVTVASQASRQSGAVDLDTVLADMSAFTARGSSRHYGRSKLMDIMFSLELARQLEGTGVSALCLCPGFNVTGLGRELSFSTPLAGVLNFMGIGDPERGAAIIARVATDPAFDQRNGAYVSRRSDRDIAPFPPADDEGARRALWEKTEALLSRFL